MFWSTRRLPFGLIGCGGMGQIHAKVLARHPATRLICTYDPVAQRAAALAREYPGVDVAADEREVYDSPAEAVVIATPHHLHKPQALAALAAGKHVLVEKPLALSYTDSCELVRAAERAGRRLLVGQVMRFWPNVARAQAAIAAGRIGLVRHVIRRRMVYQRDAGRPWAYDRAQTGGWVLQGNACHEVDTVLYLTGARVTGVEALAAHNNPKWGDIDELAVLLRLDSGAVACLSQSLNCQPGGLDTVIIGTRGTITLSQLGTGIHWADRVETLGGSDGFGEQLADVVAAVRSARPSRIEAANVLETMRTLDLIRARLEATPVEEPTYAYA